MPVDVGAALRQCLRVLERRGRLNKEETKAYQMAEVVVQRLEAFERVIQRAETASPPAPAVVQHARLLLRELLADRAAEIEDQAAELPTPQEQAWHIVLRMALDADLEHWGYMNLGDVSMLRSELVQVVADKI